MGDHRARIEIEAEFHGVKRQMGMSVNYDGEGGAVFGVDDRIVKFFRDLYEAGMLVYAAEVSEFQAELYRDEIERAERQELARLKTKYEAARGGSHAG